LFRRFNPQLDHFHHLDGVSSRDRIFTLTVNGIADSRVIVGE
jgi:hypothetical protein